MFLSRILCPPRFKELLLSYRKTIWGAALLEVGLILCYLEYVALRTDTQFFYSGDHHWSNSVDLAGCQLSRFNFLVTQDLERWLNTLNPETPTYDYLSGHLDRQVWNFAVATAGVTHLGEDLGGLVKDLGFWEDIPPWELSELTRFRLLRWGILGAAAGLLFYLFYLKCRTPPGSFVAPTDTSLRNLVRTYQKLLVVVSLGEWFLLMGVYDSVFVVFEGNLYGGNLSGGRPLVEEITSRLNRSEGFVREDISGFLELVPPDTFDYDYLSGHLDRQVWNFAVATAGVTHLGEDLGGLPFWGPDVAARGILLRVLRRGALVVFLGLGCYLWVRR